MWIESLSGSGFRNLKPFHISIDAQHVMLEGDNGQGKTNILEALYLCATGRSFRSCPIQSMITHGEKKAQCRAVFQRQGVRHEVTVGLQAGRRDIRADGRVLQAGISLLELVNVVAFFAEDLMIAKGPPESRRRFFDRTIANHSKAFVQHAVAYQRVLKARNRLLQTKSEQSLLAVYDQQLIHHGTLLMQARTDALLEMGRNVTVIFQDMIDKDVALTLSWTSGLQRVKGNVESDNYQKAFAEALKASLAKDMLLGATTVGPHRADLHCQINGYDARTFASAGQARCLVLAFKLAEVLALTKRLGQPPILLLDDVSSELDSTRAKRFFKAVCAASCQIWLSTTGAAHLPLVGDVLNLRVSNGQIAEHKRTNGTGAIRAP